MNPNYPLVSQRACQRCEYCRAPEAIFNFRFEVDHIVPLSLAGEDVEENLALACRSCNLHKTDRLDVVDEATQAVVLLFHPRQQEWSDHFRADRATGTIVGLTAIGRATVAHLRMNSESQQKARKHWTLLGLFP